jgi:hypothetical protein
VRARLASASAVVALVAVAAAAPAASAVDAANGGFETGTLTGWAPLSGTNVSVTSVAPHTDTYAAAISRRTTNGPAAITDSPDQFSQLPAGSTCTAKAWVKGPTGLKATVKWFARSGTTTVSSVTRTVVFTGGWQQSTTVNLTMPSAASTADLQLVAPAFPVGQTWFVDDVTATCAAPPPPPPPPTPPAQGLVGQWLFDEPAGAPTTAVDSSDQGNHGTNFAIRADGRSYTFNGTDSRVVVPDSDTLDPGTADFSFGLTLQMAQPPLVGETYDALRKGLSTTKGGEYKLEIVHSSGKALARCVVKDALKVSAAIRAGTSLADNRPHAVACRRTGNSVSVVVDGVTKATRTVTALGSVANTSSLAMGAKAEGTAPTGFDWYLGTMHEAWVRTGS